MIKIKTFDKFFRVLLSFVLAFALVPTLGISVAGATEDELTSEGDAEVASDEAWEVADFTYDDAENAISDASQLTLYDFSHTIELTIEGRVITGFSDQGAAKLAAGNTDLVIPKEDDQGGTVVGVATNAFKGKGLTSVQLPEGCFKDYTQDGKTTSRGYFGIFYGAFANNNLTELTIPEGVLLCGGMAFYGNSLLKKVSFPKTLWWIENTSFAKCAIEKLTFTQTTDFGIEFHGMPFAYNKIKTVTLPDNVVYLNDTTFMCNTGNGEEISASAPAAARASGYSVVDMFTSNADLLNNTNIKCTNHSSTKGYYQRLINGEEPIDTDVWEASDFTWTENDTDKTAIVTGLSDRGVTKRDSNKDIVIPEKSSNGNTVTEIASSDNTFGGVFATETVKINSVTLASTIKKIGSKAFQNAGLTSITFNDSLQEIGEIAFQTNSLKEVILPESCLTIGKGAFASNSTISKVKIPSKITKIPEACFGCSDAENYMTNWTEVEIPATVTEIEARAFAGNNFKDINIPENVKTIGQYAFSTKNYLMNEGEVTLTLPEGLETIGEYAFRNKAIASVWLPTTVTALPENAFLKQYSGDKEAIITEVYVTTASQYDDTQKFPRDCDKSHKLVRYCNVEFNSNGASDFESLLVLSGNKISEPSPAPTKKGYELDGWYSDEKLTTKFNFDTDSVTSDLTLYAKWTPETYWIDYLNIDGATNPNKDTTYTIESADITLKDATKEGYVFDGWYSKDGSLNGNWGERITKITKGSTGDVKLYAKWTKSEDPTPVTEKVTMYRLYNKWTGEHFYTSNADEQKGLVKIGWNDEGVGWYAPKTSSTPVFRLYNPYVEGGDHHYTMDEKERDACVAAGWSYEGIAWYSCETTDADAKPLYRQYNPNEATGTHNYTLSEDEAKKVVAAGWRDEGKAWYGYESE